MVLFKAMYKMTLSKQFLNIKCSLKTKPVSTKKVKNNTLLFQGKDRGSGSPSAFEGVCFLFLAAQMPWLQALWKTNQWHQVASLLFSSSPDFSAH